MSAKFSNELKACIAISVVIGALAGYGIGTSVKDSPQEAEFKIIRKKETARIREEHSSDQIADMERRAKLLGCPGNLFVVDLLEQSSKR